MSTGTFEKQVNAFVTKTQEKLLAAAKNAIRKVVIEAQTTLDDGGKMHVDTGFLRWSGSASLNQIPAGLSKGRKRENGEEGVLPEYALSEEGGRMLNEALTNMKIGDTFYFGWTAVYAPKREMYDGFMASAVRNFSFHFDNEVRRLK